MKTVRVLLIHFTTAALIAGVVGGVCYLALVKLGSGIAAQVEKLIKDTDTVAVSVDAVVRNANGKYGLIGEATAAARESRKTIDVLQKTSLAERAKVEQFSDVSIQAVRDLDATIKQAGETLAGMQADLGRITDSADGALKPLGLALDHITTLTDTLDAEVKEGGAGAKDTADELNKALADLDKLISDPDIVKILASSADTSHHLAGAAESVDIALAPWRKKASQLKMIIEKALGMVKFVYAF